MSDRNTHFQGFARLVWEQLNFDGLTNFADNQLPVSQRHKINREIEQAIQKIIAQRAYDLMYNAVEKTPLYTIMSFHGDEETHQTVQRVPDLTKWTEQEHQC